MKIALAFNEPLPSRYTSLGEQAAVGGIMESVNAIDRSLRDLGHTVELVAVWPPMDHAANQIASTSADLIFNLFEGFDGLPNTEWQFAERIAEISPVTGAPGSVLRRCLDKAAAKCCLRAAGLPTAPWQTLSSATVKEFSLNWPAIVKPLTEDGSHGLGDASVVADLESLAERVAWVEINYGSPVIVEEFLPGREFNVAVLGGQQPKVLPESEMVYRIGENDPRILTYASKWAEDDPDFEAIAVQCPADVSRELRHEIQALAIGAWNAVGEPPYVRMDLRCDADGVVNLIEVNPNPDLSPTAGFALQASRAGLAYRDLVAAIVSLVRTGSVA